MSYKLFLDDFREPHDCVHYMHQRIGAKNPIYLEEGWKVAKNYDHFIRIVIKFGLPEFVSFDHDISPDHYGLISKTDFLEWREYYDQQDREMTGYDCAKWLVDYCIDNKLKLPQYAVHSMNQAGAENISNYLRNAIKHNDL